MIIVLTSVGLPTDDITLIIAVDWFLWVLRIEKCNMLAVYLLLCMLAFLPYLSHRMRLNPLCLTSGTASAPSQMFSETPSGRASSNTCPATSCWKMTLRYAALWWRKRQRSHITSFVRRMSVRTRLILTPRQRCRRPGCELSSEYTIHTCKDFNWALLNL